MKNVLICLCLVIILSGCSNNNSISFHGKSKNWSASYTITNLKGEYQTKTVTLTYNGDAPSKVGKVKYKFSAGPHGGNGESELSGYKKIIHTSSGNGAVVQKDEIIDVTVEWNDVKEELYLSANAMRKRAEKS